MLRKLLKYEFKANGRILLPLFGAAVLLAVISAVSGRIFSVSDSVVYLSILRIVALLLIVAFVIFVIAVVIISLGASILRFKNNLLGREGYLSNVLPVTAQQQITAKLTAACVYEILGFITAVVSVMIFICIASGGPSVDRSEFFSDLKILFTGYGGHIAAFIAEAIILSLVSLVGMNLMFYASLAVGHSFNDKKLLKSVLAFVGFYFITQIINGGLLNLSTIIYTCANVDNLQSMHLGMISLIVLQSFYAVAYFVITNYFMRARLNLE